ncbi:MAG: DUF2752 domain-containing protein [Sandaracinus sp.]|nr:DUF2752 domain-containing protein [Myxococcales bacterium]MCB9604246.1 DUF2752 domain-containing protein [Sandaracinus sp.]MCB9615785.1 DUF2752 domain-containing protein [Sandaracinus sp.]MCB9617608.1 DUF2752 domain-containing protein [Sandaracinus sp.]MCB9622299.1 DUF2752 domain-containing protein [Sandaracinus sp.]
MTSSAEALAAPKPLLRSRIAWFIFLSIATAVVATAASLSPSPLGHGTHTQLGLPPCGFLSFTGVPCPGCGLTTSFAHMVRFEVVGAARANAFGVPLFLVTFFSIPISAMGLWRGWGVLDTLDAMRFERVAVMLSLCSIVSWGMRLLAYAVH